ncbi:MAG: cytidylate kinase-like family protein [Clostridia bacterium]|nr:cytidylate kinase-like family protein [Clostridia bacterium]
MDKFIITINREFCGGGNYIGKKLSERLEVPFYDKELVNMAAKEAGYAEATFEKVDEVATNSLLYSLIMGVHNSTQTGILPDNDKLFNIQADIIRKAADKGSCVVLGRCSNYILREEKNLVRVFLKADMDFRKDRYEKLYGQPEKGTVEDAIEKRDKKRSSYFKFYTGHRWEDTEMYDLVINTGKIGFDNSVDMIIDYVNKMSK